MEGDQSLVGIELALDPGFKTYWRTPGESGLPPRFDWAGSENVASVEILWPAPSRSEDLGGVAYAYSGGVVLPAVVKAKEAGKPMTLALQIDYGICKDICIPAQAELSLTIGPKGSGQPLIDKALAKVPQPRALGAPDDLAIAKVEPKAGDKPTLAVTVRAPPGAQPSLFAEGPEDWYLSTSLPDKENRFTVTVEEKPKDAADPVGLRLTLVAGDQAIETQVSLDGNLRPR
jgi:DsbC/DsbD-like thiol-disulfide interchange protein